MWNSRGTHPEGGVLVCDRCGQPRQVRFSDVRPEGFEGPSPFGELLPVSCDCADAEEARQAVAAMCAAEDRPMVACRCCACVQAARRVAATWARAVPSNFVAWVDEGRRAACLTSRYVYEQLRSGALRATRSPRLSLSDGRAFAAAFSEARRGYALLVDVDSLGAVA